MEQQTWERRLAHVPPMAIAYDGDCSQALGLELPIVGINLAHRTDRWEALSTRMGAVGLTKLIKAPAIVGAKLTDVEVAAVLDPSAAGDDGAIKSHLTLTRPAIGCFLSHLAIWRWVAASRLPRVLVFEDDACPLPHFKGELFRNIVGALPAEAGLVFPGRILMAGMAEAAAPGSHLARLYYFNGTFAYLITPAACRTLLAELLPLQSHIDHQISRVLVEQRDTFRAWSTEPQFFEPDWSLRSDIYIPLSDEKTADHELGGLFDRTRALLLAEGRPLLPA